MSIQYPEIKKESVLKLAYNDPSTAEILSSRLQQLLMSVPPLRPIVIVCVGTDRSTGDSLGPLVGSHLGKLRFPGLHLYGTLDQPVHAVNLQETLDLIMSNHNNPFIIAIDACLGQVSSVGCIQMALGPVKPGAGVNKELPPVGDMHITGIVNVGGFMEYFVLQNTRLSLVMSMSETIASVIYSALVQLKRYQSNSMLKLE